MSYDIRLKNSDDTTAVIEGGHDLRGGTYALGGTPDAWLNVTYNYAPHFYRVLGDKGIRSIYGMTGRASIPVLSDAILRLATDTSTDYWEATEGNARAALVNLRTLAELCPDAVWDGD